jgi:ribosome-associated protein
MSIDNNDRNEQSGIPPEDRGGESLRGRPREGEEAAALADEAARLILEKKGHDVTIMDVGELTDVTRFFVLCSCDNDVHVRAVAEHIRDELAKVGVKPWKTEGWQGMTWILMDYVDVVLHVFYHETRNFYKLERLWADAPSRRISDDPATGIPTSSGRIEERDIGEDE